MGGAGVEVLWNGGGGGLPWEEGGGGVPRAKDIINMAKGKKQQMRSNMGRMGGRRMISCYWLGAGMQGKLGEQGQEADWGVCRRRGSNLSAGV